MESGRLEAFSDGVLAIIITIMVLEFKVPHGVELEALRPLAPVALSYLLSFVYVGIYWNNHHHMLYATHRIGGVVLWANLHLLFWLSLVPFVTGWMGENHFAPLPTAAYGVVLLMAAVAYSILQRTIVAMQPADSILRTALSHDTKGTLSLLIYLGAIPVALVRPWVAGVMYTVVALMWLAPDRRIERALLAQDAAPRADELR